MTSIDEQQRIRRILDGEREEYGWFVRQYSQQVLDFTSRLVTDTKDAEELAQDAFVKAFRSLATFAGQASFCTWVCRIAYHEALNHLRRRRLYTVELDDRTVVSEFCSLTSTDNLPTDHEERILLMEEAIGLLPPNERMLIHLFYYENRPLREIAYLMDVEPTALATRLHRIRKKLLTMIKAKENDERTERE